MVKFHSAVLFVTDIQRSKKFYIELLDLEVEHDFGTNIIFKGGVSIWQIQPGHLIYRNVDAAAAKGTRFELYFETESMDVFLQKLDKTEHVKLHDIIEEPWGQNTLRFYDPDGHLIEVGEKLESFVYRFYKSGMTAEQVSQRTSVAVDDVRKIIADAERN